MREEIDGMKIGTRVRIIFEDNSMSDIDYTIIGIKKYQEVKDWCDHFVVKSDEGVTREIREYSCVFPPKECEDEIEKNYKFLADNGVYADVCNFNGTSAIVVSISWGDWKHEHLWARHLMSYLGYREIGCKVTEEDGSDTYSAEHYFLKTA